MRKITKVLLSIVLAFTFIVNVNAYSKDDELRIEVAQSSGNTNIGCIGCYAYKDDKGVTHQYNTAYITQYQLSDGSPAYCMDAHLQAYRDVKVDKVITSDTSESKYYIGLAAIGAAGYSKSNTSRDGISGFDFYSATNIAIRMYAIAMGHGKEFSNGSISGSRFTYQLANTTANWMSNHAKISNDATGYNCVKKENKTLKKCFEEKINLSGITNLGLATTAEKVKKNYLSGDGIMAVAKDLLKIGMQAAADNSVGHSSASISKDTELSSKKENSDKQFVKKDYYAITSSTSNLENVSNISATCKNCNSVNGNPSIEISGYYLSDGTTYKSGTPTANDLKTNKKLYLEVKGTIDRDKGYDCTDLEYTINYNLANASFDYTVYILKAKDSSVVKEAQRFYAIITDTTPVGDNSLKSVDKKMDFCGNNNCEYQDPTTMTDEEKNECCDDWANSCDDDEAYCEYFGEYCATCETKITHPEACTDYDDAGVSEGEITEALDDDGTDNSKLCLLMRKKDEAGNSYKSAEYENNPYCQVYCKEHFDYKLPGAVTINSGTYFKLDAEITGTKSCYTSAIDTDKFVNDVNALNSKYSSYSAEYEKEYSAIVKNYNACVNLEEKYECFDPKIKYDYAEDYDDGLNNEVNKEFKELEVKTLDDGKPEYCNGEVDDGYNCLGSKTASTISVTKYANGGGSVTETYNTAKYVKSTITKKGTYSTPSVFYTKYPSGAVISKEEFDKLAEAEKGNYSAINGLPVSIKSESGHHKFTLTLSNIGEFYDKGECTNGRLLGSDKSVYNKKNGKIKAEYQCKYTVNCPDCEFDCVGDLCEIEQCDGKGCVATCVGNGCAYSNLGLSYAYRTVSLNNLNPNEAAGRKLGYNWTGVKAEKTIEEIEKNGEKAYKEPEYSFTLTPALITAIKEYNKGQLDKGGYTNETLTCSDDKYGNENVNCESKFISDLVNGIIGTSNNVVTVPEADEKFTSWLDSDYCNGTCTISDGTGPSWK